MNQLIWRFGFYDKKFETKKHSEWRFDTKSKEQDDYAESEKKDHDKSEKDDYDKYAEDAIAYLLENLIEISNTKNNNQQNQVYQPLQQWLENALNINNLINQQNGTIEFSEEATKKLMLLFRGHYLEIYKELWFKKYIKDHDKLYTTFVTHEDIKKLFSYSDWSRMKTKWRKKIMFDTKVVVCPYCDRQYITSYSDSQTTAELDHFYLKDKYPLFALSLFNFIPSCHICNALFKRTNELNIYPYEHGFDDLTRFVLKPELTGKRNNSMAKKTAEIILTKKGTEFGITQVPNKSLSADMKKKVSDDIDVLKLNSVYEIHQDYVRDLLEIKRYYENEEYLEYVGKLVKRKVTTDMIRRFLIGDDWTDNCNDRENPLKRPLSKLTNAILQDKYDILIDTKNNQ